MKKLYAVLPCYNEAENIGALIKDWLSYQDDFSSIGYALTVVAIDDKSKDDTKNIICDFTKNMKMFFLSHTKLIKI